MLRLLLIAVLVGSVTVPVPTATAVKGLMHMKQTDMLDEFLSTSDSVKVVYFCKGT